MAIVDVLKKLHKTMTGKDSVGETIEEVIGDLDENYTGGGGGGSDLPAPGAAGNVMTSTGDGWESAEPSGGELVCNFTIDGQGNMSCDKRVSAILDAIANDRPVVGSFDDGDRVNYLIVGRKTESMVVLQMVESVSNRRFYISNIYGTSGDPSDTWELEPIQYETLFSVDSVDNGKVLGVESGAYAFVTSPLIVTFSFDADTQTISADMSVNDIIAAAQTRPVLGVLPMGGLSEMLCFTQGGAGTVCFSLIEMDGATNKPKGITCLFGVYSSVTQTDSWDIEDCPLLPPISQSVAGYILAVSNDGESIGWVSPT